MQYLAWEFSEMLVSLCGYSHQKLMVATSLGIGPSHKADWAHELKNRAKAMQISRGTLMSLMAFAPFILYGQPGPSAPAAPAAPGAPASTSSVIQPALSTVESTLNALKIDKWKKG